MPEEETAQESDVLEEFESKWSNPTGSYYYCMVLPNGDVEYHGTKGAVRQRLTEVYGRN